MVNNVMVMMTVVVMMMVVMDQMCAGNAWNGDRDKDGEGDQVTHWELRWIGQNRPDSKLEAAAEPRMNG